MTTVNYQDSTYNYEMQDRETGRNASGSSWGTPKEFVGSPKKTFPLSCLPKEFREYAEAQCRYYGVAPEFVGSVMLYMGGVATQPHNVILRDGWEVPTFIDMITIGKPGEKKSSIRSENVRPFDNHVREWNISHRDEITLSQQHKDYLKRKRDRAQAESVKNEDDERIDEAKKLSVEYANYEEIPPKRIYVSDCTPERLVMLMAEQGGMLNVISSEGAFISNICGRYSGEPNADAVLKGFDMESIEVDRVGRTGERIERPRFSFLQCIQPVVFEKLAGNQELRGQGLIDRCLLVCPASSIGKVKFFAEPIPEKLRTNYDNAVLNLLRHRDSPKWLKLTTDARQRFGEFADEFNQKILPRDFEGLEGAGAKHVGIVGRICGILALMENPDATEVTLETVEKAIELSEYYQEQIRFIHQGHLLNPEESLAKYLMKRIRACYEKGLMNQDNGELTLSFRDLSRACNKAELRKKDDFVEPLKVLQGMGYVDFDERSLKVIQINPEGVKR